MTIPMLVVLQVISPVSVCSITLSGINYLIVVEHGNVTINQNINNVENNFPIEETKWHIWSYNREANQFKEVLKKTIPLPVLKYMELYYSNKNLYGLLETNFKKPAFFVQWENIDEQFEKISKKPDNISPLELSVKQVTQIKIQPNNLWSSLELGCNQWLFNPEISVDTYKGNIWMSFNSADAGTVFFRKNTTNKFISDLPSIKNTVNTKITNLSVGKLIMFRRPQDSWSVFYNTMRYSRAIGPTSLPLIMAELNEQFELKNEVNLSETLKIDDIFIYDFASDEKRRLGLVTVGGTIEKPLLKFHVSDDNGKTWNQKENMSLPKIPSYLTLAMTEKEAMIGMAFHQKDFFHYEVNSVISDLQPNSQQRDKGKIKQ